MLFKLEKLGNVCNIKGGYAFKSQDFIGSGTPVIKIANISNQMITFNENTVYLPKDFLIQYSDYIVSKGDILIALSGATTGKFGIYKLYGKALLNQRVGKIVPIKSKLYFKYIYYYMNKLKDYILTNAGGAAQPNISTKDIEEMNIPLPPLETQKKIAVVLDKAQELIDKRKEQIEYLDEFIKSVFLDMFGDPVKNPKGWITKKLGETGDLKRGRSKHRPRNAPELLGGSYPLIQTGDISNSGLYIKKYFQTYSELGLNQSKMWSVGTLCITIAANIAKTGILTFDACFPDSVVAYLPNNNMNNNYVQFWFMFLQEIIEATAPVSAQKNINLEILGRLNIPVPPIDLQSQFAKIVQTTEQQKELLQKSLTELENNFNGLMQRAFEGGLFN